MSLPEWESSKGKFRNFRSNLCVVFFCFSWLIPCIINSFVANKDHQHTLSRWLMGVTEIAAWYAPPKVSQLPRAIRREAPVNSYPWLPHAVRVQGRVLPLELLPLPPGRRPPLHLLPVEALHDAHLLLVTCQSNRKVLVKLLAWKNNCGFKRFWNETVCSKWPRATLSQDGKG